LRKRVIAASNRAALVHVDVDDLRAAFHLLAGHVQRFFVAAFLDQLRTARCR
jgi:hypothetical protein